MGAAAATWVHHQRVTATATAASASWCWCQPWWAYNRCCTWCCNARWCDARGSHTWGCGARWGHTGYRSRRSHTWYRTWGGHTWGCGTWCSYTRWCHTRHSTWCCYTCGCRTRCSYTGTVPGAVTPGGVAPGAVTPGGDVTPGVACTTQKRHMGTVSHKGTWRLLWFLSPRTTEDRQTTPGCMAACSLMTAVQSKDEACHAAHEKRIEHTRCHAATERVLLQ